MFTHVYVYVCVCCVHEVMFYRKYVFDDPFISSWVDFGVSLVLLKGRWPINCNSWYEKDELD